MGFVTFSGGICELFSEIPFFLCNPGASVVCYICFFTGILTYYNK